MGADAMLEMTRPDGEKRGGSEDDSAVSTAMETRMRGGRGPTDLGASGPRQALDRLPCYAPTHASTQSRARAQAQAQGRTHTGTCVHTYTQTQAKAQA